jgi:eukaryotic-like serine/threonine-protein kinase
MKARTRGISPEVKDRGGDPDLSQGQCEAETVQGPGALDTKLWEQESLAPEELVARLCDDQVRRWNLGQRVPAEAYLAQCPRLDHDGEAAFELIYGEFLLREHLGDAPTTEEFSWRFPWFAARFARQLELHGILNSEVSGPQTIVRSGARGIAGEKKTGDPNRSVAPGYEILGELGRGGMGIVYKAWQVSLKRVVALKVIRAGAHTDADAAARFHAEAEASARFQHPNIVQVFEVGENEESAYLVLEYVSGGGLDRKLSGSLQDPGVSAKLIESLARAIHYAHRRGIVHRDLKPANVLLTEDGIPKITDFGLAKLLERDDGLTNVGELLGTPSYMAPEQVKGTSRQITPATDVYALGAILYEMLTGRPPFKGTTPLSTLEQVSSQEPLTPSKIQRHTPRDLETICLKCLQKDPRRRYATADLLADDLRRFLDRQPILARPTPAWERAWKWALRRPAAAAVLVSVLAAVTLFLVMGWHYNTRLRAALRTAQAAEQEADSSAGRAVEQRNRALQAFKKLVYDVQEKLGQTPATRSIRQSLLNTAITGLEEIASSTAGSPPDLSQAVAHQKLGDIFRIIGRSAEARRHYDQSRSLAEALLASDPDSLPITEDLYQTHMGLGSLHVTAGQLDAAKVELARAVAMAEAIAAHPQNDAKPQGLIEAYLQLGRAYSFAREYDSAEKWFRKMQDLAARWVADEPADVQARDFLAASYRKLGDLKKFAKDFAAAREGYVRAIAIGRQVLLDEPGSLPFKAHLGLGLDDLAGVARSQGKIDEARKLFQEAEQLNSELVESDPELRESRFTLLHTRFNQAKMEEGELRFSRAAELWRRIRDQLRQLQRDGLLEGRTDRSTNPSVVAAELAYCEAAPTAIKDLDFARSQPALVSARLLLLHARMFDQQTNDQNRLAAVGEALTGLASTAPQELFELARYLAIFIKDLDSGRWPGFREAERQQLRARCTSRGTELLRLAADRGFEDRSLIESAELAPLRNQPGVRAQAARLKPPASEPADRVKTSE